MNKKTFVTGMVLLAGLAMASCSQNDGQDGFDQENKECEVYLSLNLAPGTTFFSSSADASTRAVSESAYRNVNNYNVVVLDHNGVEKLNCKASEVASRMPLVMSIGSFAVTASYGTESPASRDAFYVYGHTTGMVKADQSSQVSVVCSPTCGRITVEFSSEMASYFSDYSVTFGGTEALAGGTIQWLKNDTEPWYVQLAEAGERVSFTINLTPKAEYKDAAQVKSGTFTLSRNKAYKMNISPVYTASGSGNATLDITVDATTIDKECDIEVPVEWVS